MSDAIPFNRPFIAGKELYYIADSVMSGKIAGDAKYGRLCEEQLQDLIGSERVLLTTSCTHALEMAALLIDIQPGDEVIMPSYTFVSTANAFYLRGAKIIFADIEPDYLNMDLDHVEKLISDKTRAIVTVHYAGNSCDMDRLMGIAGRNDIVVIEDAAQAINATYKKRPLGSIGQLATLSFHETKNLICGEGGALMINDKSFKDRAEIIREKGTNRSQFFRGEVDKYSWVDVGSSYIMSDILAAFLKAQLEMLDANQIRRTTLYKFYETQLTDVLNDNGYGLPKVPSYNNGNHHIFYLICPSLNARTKLMDYLKAQGISAVFHYSPLHSSPMGLGMGYKEGDLPVTEKLSDRLLRLPLFSQMTHEEVVRVVAAIHAFFASDAQ